MQATPRYRYRQGGLTALAELTGGLGVTDLPREPAGLDLRSWKQGCHLPLRTTAGTQGSRGSVRMVMFGPLRHPGTSSVGPYHDAVSVG